MEYIQYKRMVKMKELGIEPKRQSRDTFRLINHLDIIKNNVEIVEMDDKHGLYAFLLEGDIVFEAFITIDDFSFNYTQYNFVTNIRNLMGLGPGRDDNKIMFSFLKRFVMDLM